MSRPLIDTSYLPEWATCLWSQFMWLHVHFVVFVPTWQNELSYLRAHLVVHLIEISLLRYQNKSTVILVSHPDRAGPPINCLTEHPGHPHQLIKLANTTWPDNSDGNWSLPIVSLELDWWNNNYNGSQKLQRLFLFAPCICYLSQCVAGKYGYI